MSIPPPFPRESQLFDGLDKCLWQETPHEALPGHPLTQLADCDDVLACLERDCIATDLEAAASRLWILSTQSSSNISPLHHQKVKDREIIVTEDPRLHLVWFHNRIFLKPIPRYLLSHVFWERLLSSVPEFSPSPSRDRFLAIRKAALGFLRSYSHLITSETDLLIAKHESLRLLPADIDWPRACRFFASLSSIPDADTSGRYQFGELRLTRLNSYSPILFGRSTYESLHGQYSDIFGRFYGTILFVFAVVTTFLNALQLGLAAEQVNAQWAAFQEVSRWFCVVTLVGTAVLAAGLVGLLVWMFTDEWLFALKCRRAKRWV